MKQGANANHFLPEREQLIQCVYPQVEREDEQKARKA